MNPGDPYVSGWHLDFMAEHLEAVYLGQIIRLVFNVPPGSSKSTLVSCMFPTWVWPRWPESEWGFSSYAQDLSKKFSTARRRIIRDPTYQEAWGHIVKLRDDQDEKLEMENTARGKFKATSTGGSSGGQHFDFLGIDDPQNPEEDNSKVDTEKACEHVRYLANTRLKNKAKSRVILVMQRLNKYDPASVLIGSDNTVHVTIPMKAPERKVYLFPISKREHVVEEGEIFWPQVYSERFVAQQKKELGPARFAAQMQQDPQDAAAKMVDRGWWEYFGSPRKSVFRIWSFDTATKEKTINDYTVGALINEHAHGFDIEKVVRRRMQAAELENFILELFNADRTDAVVIEDKDSGQRVIQYFRAKLKIPVQAFQPSTYGDKVQRLSLIVPLWAAKKVAVPDPAVLPATWVADFLDEFDEFPRGKHDDQVDAVTSGILYLTRERKVGRFDKGSTEANNRAQPIMPNMKDRARW